MCWFSCVTQVEDRVLSTANWEKVVQLCRRWVEAEQRKQQHSMVEEEEDEEEQGDNDILKGTSHKGILTSIHVLC